MNLKAMEKTLIAETLRRCGGNRAVTARELGLDTSTLYRKIKDLKIEAPARDGRGLRR